ncbi:MAG: type II secretion system F family protein [Alphaproteobacteria bacterium]
MPTYRYKAVTDSGNVVEDDMEAPSQSAVIERLHDLGHLPIRADEIKGPSQGGWLRRRLFATRRVSHRDVGLVTRELATLLQAGLPLDRSLEIVKNLAEKEGVSEMLAQVLDRVRGGVSLADAMASQGRAFPRFYVSMVRAGETGGALDTVLGRLADFMEKSQALTENVKSALVYPIILLTMAGVSVVLLLTVVIPQFTPLFEDAGEALPVAAQILVSVGEVFQHYWWAIGLAIVGLVLLARRELSSPVRRYRWDRVLLRSPLVGDLVAKLAAARFSRTLATLLRNGVPVITALSIVKDTLGNTVMARAVEGVAARVKEGQGLAQPLMAAQVFPDLAISLVRVGEETGQLEQMLDKVAEIYDREVQRTVERMLALLVPVLTIGLGVLIAAIIVSVLTAILSVNQLVF